MFGTQVNLKFRDKYRNRKRLAMPSIAPQTCSTSPRQVKAPGGLLTPPDSSSGSSSARDSRASSVESLHGPDTPYDHLRDAFENVPEPRRPRVRVVSAGRKNRPSVHIHLDNVHVTPMQSPVAERPRMVDVAVQTDAPPAPAAGPDTLLGRFNRWIAPIKPFLDVLTAVGLFLLERVGFGIRLN